MSSVFTNQGIPNPAPQKLHFKGNVESYQTPFGWRIQGSVLRNNISIKRVRSNYEIIKN